MQNRYRFNVQSNLLGATKGKVIFGFGMAILALIAAWGISRLVFEKIIVTVDEVSTPDEKLKLVNHIFNSVSNLDQKQTYQATKKGTSNFINESRSIKLGLDTLSNLYLKDPLQLNRIRSIKKLLVERDRQFIIYLTVRDSLLNTRSFSKEIEKLNAIFSERAFQADSAIYITESKTSTTTIKDQDNKGFFNKLFGKKKPDAYKVISEELKIKKDTLNQFAEDSILQNMESSLNYIKSQQKLKSNKFIEKERSLASASNKLTQQMLSVLEEVRAEALKEVSNKGTLAKTVVSKGIQQITFILIAFFALTVLLIYFILTDISKGNRYRLALEKAKDLADYNARAKQRFLSNMSHEIRTPLQSIVGYSELIQVTETAHKKPLEAIKLSAAHLLNVINEVLDYSRVTSGKFHFENEAFNAKATFTEVLLIMRPLASEKGLTLIAQLNIEPDLLLLGDAFRLKQILYNLLGNAIKFTEQGEISLVVNAKLKPDHKATLEVKITDTGVGISEKNLTTIFEEFENGNQKESPKFNSTGLGLSIVKQLIDLQRGKITVKSEPGIGSIFEIKLDFICADEQIVKQDLAIKEPNRNYTKGLVWIIDDDQLILDLCALILSRTQIAYQTFNKPKELLDLAIPENLRYILMDMRMPEIDGLTLFMALKERVSKDVEFFAITAQVLPNEKLEILESGFNGIVNKPFTQENLLNVLVDNQQTFENFNPENLKKMTFGDKNQLTKVLTRFAKDCLEDIDLLKEEIVKRDYNFCRLIVHRLAGRTGQIGYMGLAHQFRKIEQQLNHNDAFTDNLVLEINRETQKLNSFITYLQERNYSI